MYTLPNLFTYKSEFPDTSKLLIGDMETLVRIPTVNVIDDSIEGRPKAVLPQIISTLEALIKNHPAEIEIPIPRESGALGYYMVDYRKLIFLYSSISPRSVKQVEFWCDQHLSGRIMNVQNVIIGITQISKPVKTRTYCFYALVRA